MRMRKKKNFDQRISKCEEIILPKKRLTADELTALSAGRAVHLEIGCGKGRFAVQTALKDKDTFLIALEREPNVCLMAMELAISMGSPENLRFLPADAASLPELLPNGSVSRIYINFCDPWPPKKQAKRRLTNSGFFQTYYNLLTDNGKIFFKTDNEKLFEFSLNQFAECELFRLRNICLDLHSTDMENIQTEYEEKFSSQGFKIFRLEAHKANAGNTPIIV